MALVNLRNATVQRIFHNGKGLALSESFQSRGEDRKSYFTAWFDTAPNVTVGDVLPEVSGLLQVKPSEYEKDGVKKTGIDVNLNGARIGGSGNTPVQSAPEPAVSTNDSWATTTPGYNDETPF